MFLIVFVPQHQSTPLMHASAKGHTAIVRSLLTIGSLNVNLIDDVSLFALSQLQY